MSTELKSIQGRHEKTVLTESGYQTQYRQSSLGLTRFAGGKDVGHMLQITLPHYCIDFSSDGYDYFAHIQLNKEQIQELIDELRDKFNLV